MIGGNTYHTSLIGFSIWVSIWGTWSKVYCVYQLCCTHHISWAILVYSTGMYTGMEYRPEIIPAQTPGFYQFQYHLYTYLPTYLPTRKKSALGPTISSIQRQGQYESVNVNPILVPGWYEKYSSTWLVCEKGHTSTILVCIYSRPISAIWHYLMIGFYLQTGFKNTKARLLVSLICKIEEKTRERGLLLVWCEFCCEHM